MIRGLLALLLLAVPATAQDAADGYAFPPLTGRVVDAADLLPADVEAALAGRLTEIERRSGHQFVVVTVGGLGGHDIADYGRRLGNHWGVGRKGIHDGVLLLVAPVERKVRIEVGRGLEQALTDDEARRIIDNDILPRFRAGQMPAGIVAGSESIIREITR